MRNGFDDSVADCISEDWTESMAVTDLVRQLESLSPLDRLLVIESATRLIRRDLKLSSAERESRSRAAAERVKDLYEPGGPLTEWTALDGEEFSLGMKP